MPSSLQAAQARWAAEIASKYSHLTDKEKETVQSLLNSRDLEEGLVRGARMVSGDSTEYERARDAIVQRLKLFANTSENRSKQRTLAPKLSAGQLSSNKQTSAAGDLPSQQNQNSSGTRTDNGTDVAQPIGGSVRRTEYPNILN